MREVRTESLEKIEATDGGARILANSILGRRRGVSRFELAPELWRVLAELGWKNVEPVAPYTGADHRKEG